MDELSAEDPSCDECQEYEPPRVERLGSLRELTLGDRGPGQDNAQMSGSI